MSYVIALPRIVGYSVTQKDMGGNISYQSNRCEGWKFTVPVICICSNFYDP